MNVKTTLCGFLKNFHEILQKIFSKIKIKKYLTKKKIPILGILNFLKFFQK